MKREVSRARDKSWRSSILPGPVVRLLDRRWKRCSRIDQATRALCGDNCDPGESEDRADSTSEWLFKREEAVAAVAIERSDASTSIFV